MARTMPHLLSAIWLTFSLVAVAQAADNRTAGRDIKLRASPAAPVATANPNLAAHFVRNHIDSLSLSSSAAPSGSTVRVTITGTGNCLARVDSGGVLSAQGKPAVDMPGGFPKFVSLTVQAAPGRYTVTAQNANTRDASCTGAASATLLVTAPMPDRRATPNPAPRTELPTRVSPLPAIGNNVAASPPADLLRPAGAAKNLIPAQQSAAYEPGQLVILWDDLSEGNKGLEILARDYNVQPSQRTELHSVGGLLVTFQLRSHQLAVLLRDLLRQQYPHWHVDLHARYQALNGPRIYLPRKIDAPTVLPQPPQLRQLRIGILDTAVTPIPALQAGKLTQRSFLASSDVPAASAHGTAIAALISGQDPANQFHALAAGAQLFVGAIMRDQAGRSGSNTATLLRGLDWLIGSGVQVINLSLGGPGDAVMASVFAKLQARDIIIVAAAGNGGSHAPPSYPAAYRGVLAVTAVDARDQSYRAANTGTYIALAAPGVDVWTPDAAGGRYVSGTSFSAAVVTGAIGLMLSHRAGLTPARVRANLCRHARDLGTPGGDPVYGCGLLQIGRTLAALE